MKSGELSKSKFTPITSVVTLMKLVENRIFESLGHPKILASVLHHGLSTTIVAFSAIFTA
jgi:hypothetical protein